MVILFFSLLFGGFQTSECWHSWEMMMGLAATILSASR
jgi:hypothetical protein